MSCLLHLLVLLCILHLFVCVPFKPEIWDVNEGDINQVLDHRADEEESPSHLYIEDNKASLCVEAKHCANLDGTGIIVPRNKNICRKPKVYCPIDQLEDYSLCGISKPYLVQERIKTSNPKHKSSFAEWPWLGIVLEHNFNVDYYLCAAVLIDDQHLLTVAHCFEKVNEKEISVRLGEYDVNSVSEPLAAINVEASVVVFHPNYTRRNLHNDIAIIRLREKVDFSEHISPICLPDSIQIRQMSLSSANECITTGWGRSQVAKGFYSDVPKKLSLPLWDHDECEASLRQTRLGPKFKLDASFVCAGGDSGEDACEGDGGGPLMCPQPDGTLALTGLVSWGIGCGQPNVPGVYTNVAHFLHFIHHTIHILNQL